MLHYVRRERFGNLFEREKEKGEGGKKGGKFIGECYQGNCSRFRVSKFENEFRNDGWMGGWRGGRIGKRV